jgi:hypothetical protein
MKGGVLRSLGLPAEIGGGRIERRRWQADWMDDVARLTIKGVCIDPADRVLLCCGSLAAAQLRPEAALARSHRG